MLDRVTRIVVAAALATVVTVAEGKADFGQAAVFLGEKAYGKARQACLSDARSGEPDCQALLAHLLDQGLGIGKDPAKAAAWFAKAAGNGHSGAALHMGFFREFGIGVSVDGKKGIEWYREAARQGHAGAMWVLGRRYNRGRWVRRDLDKAVELFRRAADLGFASALNMLGIMYEKGRGVEEDYAAALVLFRQAAARGGLADAQFNIGRMYEGGKGVEVNPAMAQEWYRKAATQGHGAAQHEVGAHITASDDDRPAWRFELGEALMAPAARSARRR